MPIDDPEDADVVAVVTESAKEACHHRRTLAARGERLRLVPTWRGPFGVEMAGEVLLPGPAAVVAPTTFEQWLGAQRPTAP
jgi:hypothetical protein